MIENEATRRTLMRRAAIRLLALAARAWDAAEPVERDAALGGEAHAAHSEFVIEAERALGRVVRKRWEL